MDYVLKYVTILIFYSFSFGQFCVGSRLIRRLVNIYSIDCLWRHNYATLPDCFAGASGKRQENSNPCYMLEKMSEKLYGQLSDEITAITRQETEPFKILSLVLTRVREALKMLRDHISNYPFKDDAQQIWFFKVIKPQFYCLRIYYLEWYSIVTNVPVGEEKTRRKFYLDELKAVQRFFQRIAFHYQYYRLNATELDHIYFIRGSQAQSVLIPEVLEIDPEFSTSQDFLFAKIKAYELLQDYLLNAIKSPFPMVHQEPDKRRIKRELRWTGDTINLVEVGFSLYDTAQFNEGKASIAEIFAWMEENFHVTIGKPHRRFDEIDGRKRISKTDFIDRMREAILNRIDRKNAYDPEKEAQRRQRADRKRKLAEKKNDNKDSQE